MSSQASDIQREAPGTKALLPNITWVGGVSVMRNSWSPPLGAPPVYNHANYSERISEVMFFFLSLFLSTDECWEWVHSPLVLWSDLSQMLCCSCLFLERMFRAYILEMYFNLTSRPKTSCSLGNILHPLPPPDSLHPSHPPGNLHTVPLQIFFTSLLL